MRWFMWCSGNCPSWLVSRMCISFLLVDKGYSNFHLEYLVPESVDLEGGRVVWLLIRWLSCRHHRCNMVDSLVSSRLLILLNLREAAHPKG